MHARYAVVQDVPGAPLVIRDIGPWDRHMTVTNDAEAVVAGLSVSGRLMTSQGENRPIAYYDSEGELVLLRVRDGKFDGFAVITEAELRERVAG